MLQNTTAHQQQPHQQYQQPHKMNTTTLAANPSPSILRRVNSLNTQPPSTPPNNNRFSSPSSSSSPSTIITTPPPSSTRVVNSSTTITPPPPRSNGVTPSPPNPNLLLPGETKINNNIVVKRKRTRRSKNFDTVTTPSPTRYVYPQPTFPTCYYPIPQIPVHPIPSLPLGIKGVYSNPYSATNYYPTHPSFALQQQQLIQQQQLQQQALSRYNATIIPATPPSKQELKNNEKSAANKEEVLAEGNCILDDDNGFNTSDILASSDNQSESSGHKRRSIVTKLRHLVNKTGECLTKTRLKEIANREKEEKEEILAYFKDDSPKPIPDKALLPENKDKKKLLDLEFSQLVSITRSAFSHLAREYSKIGIDIETNRFVKPEKSSESTIPSLLSDTTHFFSMVESLIESKDKNESSQDQDQMGSTVLNVLKTMESVLLDDSDTRILLSHPSITVYPNENDSEEFYEEIEPEFLFYNTRSNDNKETESLNTSISTVTEKLDFAQQAEVNCSSITIQTDDKSFEEVSMQTSPLESSSVDIQTEEEEKTVSSISVDIQTVSPTVLMKEMQTDPVEFAEPKKQLFTIDIQTDEPPVVEMICISTMTDELPIIEKPVTIQETILQVQQPEEQSNSKKRKKDDSSSSSSSNSESSESEEVETKPRRKLRKRTVVAKTTKKKKDEPVYFVEKVVKHDNIDGKHWFYVKWEGFSSRFNSWVEEHDILDKSLIRKFIKK